MLWKRALISLEEDKSSDLFCGMLMTRQTVLKKMLCNNIERLKLVPKIFHLSNPEGVEEPWSLGPHMNSPYYSLRDSSK